MEGLQFKLKNSMVNRWKTKMVMLKAVVMALLWLCLFCMVAEWSVHTPRIVKDVSLRSDLTMSARIDSDFIAIDRPHRPEKSDPSDFQDTFDADRFIASLRDEVRILKELPSKLKTRVESQSYPGLTFLTTLLLKHKVVHLEKTDSRLANNGLPLQVVSRLRRKGPFLVLHLRYEKDMLAFTGCTQGCSQEEADELTKMRYAHPWWKVKVINSGQNRKEGSCPLTPEETSLTLQALGIDPNIQIYIAAGEIYGGERRMRSAFPNVVRKETLLKPEELSFFQNHTSQMAALDYIVSLESDIFIPTYNGNIAKVDEGHLKFLNYKKTITLDRKFLVQMIDHFTEGSLTWEEFSSSIKEAHANHMGSFSHRTVIPGNPKQRTTILILTSVSISTNQTSS